MRRAAVTLVVVAVAGAQQQQQRQEECPFVDPGHVGFCIEEYYGQRFAEIGAVGTNLSISSELDGLVAVALPFPFPFFGVDYEVTTVDTNGNLFFGPNATSLYADERIVGSRTRIAVAANDWDMSGSPSERVLTLDTGSSFIVSWESDLSAFPGDDPENNGDVEFQAELFPSGDIELRYGTGELLPGGSLVGPTSTMFVGVESAIYPPGLFSVFGGATRTFPSGQGLRFQYDPAILAYACSYLSTTASPTATPVPTAPSPRPTTVPTSAPSLVPTSSPTEFAAEIGICTQAAAGSTFAAIGDVPGTVELTSLSDSLDGLQVVDLPFAFPFFGTDFTQTSVDTNGNLFFGPNATSLYQDFPIDGARTRIAVAANDWDLRGDKPSERILTLDTGASFIVSWELDLAAFPWTNPANNGDAEFQVELFPNGDLEIRFGTGELLPFGDDPTGRTDTIFVGLESVNSSAFLDVFGGPTTR